MGTAKICTGARVHLLGPGDSVTAALAARLSPAHEIVLGEPLEPLETIEAVVYRPRLLGKKLVLPDLKEAEARLRACAASRPARLVLLSSAAVHTPRYDHPGHVEETVRTCSLNRISRAWKELEELAELLLPPESGTGLTILRPVAVLAPDGPDYLNRLLRGKVAFTLAGHEPSIQLLSLEELAEAVARAVEQGRRGIYHVAPDGVVPLRAALRRAGVRRVPVPYTVQRLVRAAAARLGAAVDPADQLDVIRYSSTVSGRKIRDEMGFEPRPQQEPGFDPYGMDKSYISAYGRTLFHFLHRYYWRIETRGLEHVPDQGRAMLVGIHRGFQPWDGVMALHTISGWVDWADGSTFLAAAQALPSGLLFPRLQVKDEQGRWRTVIDDMGIPAGKPKTIAVDLTGKFLSSSREVRIETSLCVYWDEIFLSAESGEPSLTRTDLPPALAELRYRGFSRPVIHPERRQPESFDYQSWMPVSMWNPTPGLYTRYGDVRFLLEEVDDRLVVLGSGDEVRLLFDATAVPALPPGWRRDFLLLVDGWAKDGDANTAFSQTVEPLPFHGMSRYPYPEGESFPDGDLHRLYRERYNTRPALRLLRPLPGYWP